MPGTLEEARLIIRVILPGEPLLISQVSSSISYAGLISGSSRDELGPVMVVYNLLNCAEHFTSQRHLQACPHPLLLLSPALPYKPHQDIII